MKKILLSLFYLFLVGVVCTGLFLSYAINSSKSPGPLPEQKIVLIERGKGVSAIANILQDESVISSALVFKIITALDSDKRPLKAGEYEFAAGIPMSAALEKIRAGETYDRKITFAEGITSWKIVDMLRGQDDLGGEIAEIPAEGALLPETYHYVKNEDRANILRQMQTAMEKTIAELWPARSANLPFTTEQEALTLASIVEKETGVASERARIAGVFINRLKLGMPLQSDPTVIYAMTKGEIQDAGQGPIGRRLLTKDLAVESPYNTYLNAGLPPGPIANPGRAAIEAVLHPEDNDYIYFVADGTGGHVFAKSLNEHNANVARWRKFRKTQQ